MFPVATVFSSSNKNPVTTCFPSTCFQQQPCFVFSLFPSTNRFCPPSNPGGDRTSASNPISEAQAVWPRCSLELYGSYASGLGLSSGLDLLLKARGGLGRSAARTRLGRGSAARARCAWRFSGKGRGGLARGAKGPEGKPVVFWGGAQHKNHTFFFFNGVRFLLIICKPRSPS